MNYKLIKVEDYAPFIGDAAVERILSKAARLRGFHVTNINSTYYGGGVAELLSSLTLLMNGLGIRAGWRVLQGSPDFFGITKKMHNALQGMPLEFSRIKREIYENVVFQNSIRNHLDHNLVLVHDPQPLPLICHYKKQAPWVWRCHIDISHPHAQLWAYLRRFVEQYDAVIFSTPEYSQKLPIPELFFLPAIDPFTTKNRRLTEKEMNGRLAHYNIPTDLPLVVQVSRFDPWKDPAGVIRAFKLARKQVDCTLVLLGNFASDDPEGAQIYERATGQRTRRADSDPAARRRHGAGQHAANESGRGAAEVDPRRLRAHGHGSDVEGDPGDRRQRGRDPVSDPRRREWFPGVVDRGDGAPDCATGAEPETARADGAQGKGKRCEELPAEPLSRAVS